jgi:hypothetical protein
MKMKTEKEPFVFLRPCLIENGGEFNGYVSLPAGHPWYGKDYGDIEADVHGGLTYATEEDGRWVIGFDTTHVGDENREWNRDNVKREADRLLEQAIEVEFHEKREEGLHWYQPYTEAVPLDLWEVFRAITYESYGEVTHDRLMETVASHSRISDKLDAYRIYDISYGFKPTIGIRYGMSIHDYFSTFITNETAALFNLDPLNRDNH